MLNFRFLGMGIAVLCVLATVGCTGMRDSGPPTFLIPYLDQDGEHLPMVELTTLFSPYRMDGAAARVYFNPQSDGTSLLGGVAQPQYTKAGRVFAPKGVASGASVATYAFFEKMYFYEKRVLLKSDVSWPRIVAVYNNVKDLPPGNEGNAAHINLPIDITAIMPFGATDKVALSFNGGALGHEHFHAHFDATVKSKLPNIKKFSKEDGAGILGCTNESANAYQLKMLRTWDEGLADFYGAITSGMPAFMLSSVNAKLARRADEPPVAMKSNLEIRNCQTDDDIDPYYNGEQLLRALYAVADHDQFPYLGADAAQLTKWERAARYVVYRLDAFRDLLMSKKNWLEVNPELALCFFVQDAHLDAATTPIVNKAFSSAFVKGVSACPAIL